MSRWYQGDIDPTWVFDSHDRLVLSAKDEEEARILVSAHNAEVAAYESRIAELEGKLEDIRMGIGCARGQRTTQFCAEMQAATARIAALEAERDELKRRNLWIESLLEAAIQDLPHIPLDTPIDQLVIADMCVHCGYLFGESGETENGYNAECVRCGETESESHLTTLADFETRRAEEDALFTEDHES